MLSSSRMMVEQYTSRAYIPLLAAVAYRVQGAYFPWGEVDNSVWKILSRVSDD